MSLHTTSASTTLGADILMARHGDRIVAWKLDKRADRTLVRLNDGVWDWAPNQLATDATPADRAAHLLGEYKADRLGLKRSEVKFIAKISLGWLVISGLATAFMVGVIMPGMDQETLEMFMDPMIAR